MHAGRLLAAAVDQQIDFIVCGGYAVNAYQVIRKTGDIDLVTRARDAPRWRGFFETLGYRLYHETSAFLQFEPPDLASWPVDLMLVDDHTFDLMRAEATPFTFAGTTCLIPSRLHLIAMKLHAIKQTGGKRLRTDAIDVIDLAEKGGIDLRGHDFVGLCERFADRATYARILDYADDQDLD